MSRFLNGCIRARLNMLITGGTGSGKTTLLNILSRYIPESERVVTIEDSAELQLQQPHVVRLETRPPNIEGKGTIAQRDLVRNALRMRPDRIVVGEIRGSEALDLVQAMTSGHGGCMATVHATYPTDTLNRIETMAMMSDVQLPLRALRAQVSSAIDMIVQTSRLRDGSRCVTHISEVQGYDPERGYNLSDIFLRRFEGTDEKGRVRSTFEATGFIPKCVDVIQGQGLSLPAAIYDAARAG
jgi:pilus assembly protein CpaF